jgi:hypothetical protein
MSGGEEFSLSITVCDTENCPIPRLEKVTGHLCIDLEDLRVPAEQKRSDMIIFYTNETLIMECKGSYLKMALEQLKNTLTYVMDNWNIIEELVRNQGFNRITKPSRLAIYLKYGLGKERQYRRDGEKRLRETSSKNMGTPKRIDGMNILIFGRNEIQELNEKVGSMGYRGFPGVI